MTVLFGANDVLDLYQNQYLPDPTPATANAIVTELTTRGTPRRAHQRADRARPRVILSTMPLMGLTPYALREAITSGDPKRSALLINFSNTFNTAVRVNIVNDGRYIGLVELDALLDAGFDDPAPTVCPTSPGRVHGRAARLHHQHPGRHTANRTTWLWASDLWMGFAAHLNLGNFARGRALGNPF